MVKERWLVYFCRCEKRSIAIMKQHSLDHNIHTNRKQFLYLCVFQYIFIISFIHSSIHPRPDPGHQEVALLIENSTVIFTCRHLATMNIAWSVPVFVFSTQSVLHGAVAGSIYSDYLLHTTFIPSFCLQQAWADRSNTAPSCNTKPCVSPPGCPNAPSSIIQHLWGCRQRFLYKEKKRQHGS